MDAVDSMADLIQIREVQPEDLDALVRLEEAGFTTDRLSRRSFQRAIKVDNCLFDVVERGGEVLGYGLVHLHKGTRLARLYSILIDPSLRGQGVGERLMRALEAEALEEARLFMRLEVGAQNHAAISLYKRLGYTEFEEIEGYYEDGTDALRMQKRIRFPELALPGVRMTWYRQSTDFTCGPASLMMAMAWLRPKATKLTQGLELDIWREATTIYMTSGHGGCHPLGLALAAARRGFSVRAFVSQKTAPFLDGVRSVHKKSVIEAVHGQFLEQCERTRLPLHYEVITVAKIEAWLHKKSAVLVMISSYRLNGDKAPHWVTITAIDDLCVYVHDSDVDKMTRTELDCQHIPIAKEDFARMTAYGNQRFSAAVVLEAK